MSQLLGPQSMVGNEFALPRPRLPMNATMSKTESEPLLAAVPFYENESAEPIAVGEKKNRLVLSLSHQGRMLLGHSKWVLVVLVVGVLGASGVEIAARYQTARIGQTEAAALATAENEMVKDTAGLDEMVPSNELQSKLQAISSQAVQLSVGTHVVNVSPATIRNWIQVTPNPAKAVDYLHIDMASIVSSLNILAQGYVVQPINQVSVTHNDGVTPSGVILAGSNGTGLSDPGSLTSEAKQLSRSVMKGSGLQFSTPLKTIPFQAVTPAAFGKLLEVDVTTKRMYAYQNGQLVNTFLVSAGKPSTPTPIGIFHIWEKLPEQTMVGPGYVQPNVQWINYFDHNGDAVHGNYWRPASVFGNINTSHGCVGLPDAQAEWVYDWAPIGTTVITYS